MISSSSSSSVSTSRSEIILSALFMGSYIYIQCIIIIVNWECTFKSPGLLTVTAYHCKISSVWHVATYFLTRVVGGNWAALVVRVVNEDRWRGHRGGHWDKHWEDMKVANHTHSMANHTHPTANHTHSTSSQLPLGLTAYRAGKGGES